MNINEIGHDYRKLTPFSGKMSADRGKPALPEKVAPQATTENILAPSRTGREAWPRVEVFQNRMKTC
ncbi:MAG: hypothetical protein V3S64_06045 [bacterium]